MSGYAVHLCTIRSLSCTSGLHIPRQEIRRTLLLVPIIARLDFISLEYKNGVLHELNSIRRPVMLICYSYTHHYAIRNWNSEEWQSIWPQLIEDTNLILEASDVPVCGPFVDNQPGVLQPPMVSFEKGIKLNGVWDDANDPFILSAEPHHGWCKTNEKPYDLAVACILLRAYMLAKDQVYVK
jgi:hypothetical protein